MALARSTKKAETTGRMMKAEEVSVTEWATEARVIELLVGRTSEFEAWNHQLWTLDWPFLARYP